MKRSADQQPFRVSDHGAFYSYRWLAWVIAAVALLLSGGQLTTLSRDAGLLLLIGVINIVATALAQGYVRIARQRPAILALDIVAGAAVLWLSGSTPLPFLPYALASLVLPALLFSWRGGLSAAAAFVALDMLGLTLINLGTDLGGLALAARPLMPMAFAGLWVTLAHLRDDTAAFGSGYSSDPDRSGLARPASADGSRLGSQQPAHPTEPSVADGPASAAPNLGGATSAVMLRALIEQRPDPTRRLLYDLTPMHDVSLMGALEQICASMRRQNDLEIQVASSGTPRSLHPAQHSVLLRVAHEALLNVQQHARAHSATLTLTYESATVTMVVRDDGVGLLDGTYERPGLHALRAIRYRLAELDGQLAVVEGEEGGVMLRATLPLEP